MDPFRTFHGLDANYVPLGGGEPVLPASLRRMKSFVYGCAMFIDEREAQLAGAKTQARRAVS